MTAQALFGLAALNYLFLVCGASILWLVRGWTTWLAFARLGGLAYLLGVASVGVLWTLLLIAGVPFSGWLIVATPVVFVGAGALGGRRLGRRLPALGSIKGTNGLVIGAVGAATTGVFLEALFRSARLHGLYAWDAWSFWVPKGKAIYHFGGLDEQFFTTLPGPSYPPLLPILDAAAFHAMGGPDVVTLHVQFWFLGAGFLWALTSVLAERVPPWILWPPMLLIVVTPRIGRRMVIPEADLLLDYFVVLAAVLVAYWMLERERSHLVLATVLLAGAVLTKREGMLLAAALVAAALLATIRTWRRAWPPLVAVSVALILIGAPWRLWYAARGVPGEGPAGGFFGTIDRAWPSLKLAIEVLFDTTWWGVSVWVALGAVVVALLARRFEQAVFFGALVAFVTLGGGWITWSIAELEITSELGANPIVRYMGAAVLVAVAGASLLLAESWKWTARSTVTREDRRGRLALASAVVVLPLVIYPAVALAGGLPRFPTRDECARPPVEGSPVNIVFGRFDHPDDAAALRDRALEVGFIGTEALLDGCGRWIAVLRDAPSIEIGEEIQREARTVDLEPVLEEGTG